MILQNFQYKNGVLLSSHEFQYILKFFLKKSGSSIFLKIDEPKFLNKQEENDIKALKILRERIIYKEDDIILKKAYLEKVIKVSDTILFAPPQYEIVLDSVIKSFSRYEFMKIQKPLKLFSFSIPENPQILKETDKTLRRFIETTFSSKYENDYKYLQKFILKDILKNKDMLLDTKEHRKIYYINKNLLLKKKDPNTIIKENSHKIISKEIMEIFKENKNLLGKIIYNDLFNYDNTFILNKTKLRLQKNKENVYLDKVQLYILKEDNRTFLNKIFIIGKETEDPIMINKCVPKPILKKFNYFLDKIYPIPIAKRDELNLLDKTVPVPIAKRDELNLLDKTVPVPIAKRDELNFLSADYPYDISKTYIGFLSKNVPVSIYKNGSIKSFEGYEQKIYLKNSSKLFKQLPKICIFNTNENKKLSRYLAELLKDNNKLLEKIIRKNSLKIEGTKLILDNIPKQSIIPDDAILLSKTVSKRNLKIQNSLLLEKIIRRFSLKLESGIFLNKILNNNIFKNSNLGLAERIAIPHLIGRYSKVYFVDSETYLEKFGGYKFIETYGSGLMKKYNIFLEQTPSINLYFSESPKYFFPIKSFDKMDSSEKMLELVIKSSTNILKDKLLESIVKSSTDILENKLLKSFKVAKIFKENENKLVQSLTFSNVSRKDSKLLYNAPNPTESFNYGEKFLSKLEHYFKLNKDDSVSYGKLHERWWFLKPTKNKIRLQIPKRDYDYENNPVLGVSSDPLPEFAGYAISNNIEVSVEILIDVINIIMHWWNQSGTMLQIADGEEATQGLSTVLHNWYSLETSLTKMKNLGVEDEYLRCFRLVRWHLEKEFMSCRQDKENNLLYNGNYYISHLVDDLISYMEDHHYNIVPLYKNVNRMSEGRTFVGNKVDDDIVSSEIKFNKVNTLKNYIL